MRVIGRTRPVTISRTEYFGHKFLKNCLRDSSQAIIPCCMRLPVMFLSACLLTTAVSAQPIMIFKGKPQYPIAVLGLDDVSYGDGCENHLGYFVVDSIAYDGVSDLVGGIRVRPVVNQTGKADSSSVPSLIHIDLSKLGQADSSWLPKLVRSGTKLLINFNRCGNGGIDFARDIYSANNLKW